MGIAYRCRRDLDCTFVLWDGAVSGEEWRRHALTLTADRDFPTQRMLTDARDASTARLAEDDVLAVTEVIAQRLGRLPEKLAVLVGQGGYELAELLQTRIGLATSVALFGDTAGACKWLTVPHAPADAVLDELRASSAPLGSL